MRTLVFAGVAALTLAAVPAFAQDTDNTATAAPVTDTSASAAPPPSGNMQFIRSEVVQPTPGDTNANSPALESGDLPICKKDQQDGCINGWQKGKKGNRPLDYWPDQPAGATSPEH